jgi:G3E family GTPase
VTGPGPADDLDWLLAPTEPADAAEATPVTVLTGFLGAGKTTLVNRILSEAHGLRIAVIVNDFGAVAIDSELIIGVEPGTVSLANGCVCCEIRGDLVAAVDSILGQDRELDALVLEASGVAEPSGIARTFTSEVFRSAIRLDGIVAVIDAEQLPAQTQDPTTRDLVFGQIGYSDIVLLNKIDLAQRTQVDAVRTFVHDRLPTVRIIETSHAQVPFHVLLGTGPTETAATPDRGTHDGHHRHGSGAFQHWTYTRDGAVDVDALLASIRLLPRSVYRIKGFVHNAHDPGHRYLLQAVGQRGEAHRFGEWADRTPSTELVIIAGRSGLDRTAIDGQLDACLTNQPHRRPRDLESLARRRSTWLLSICAVPRRFRSRPLTRSDLADTCGRSARAEGPRSR